MNCTTVLPFAAPISHHTGCWSLVEPSYHHSFLNSTNILVMRKFWAKSASTSTQSDEEALENFW